MILTASPQALEGLRFGFLFPRGTLIKTQVLWLPTPGCPWTSMKKKSIYLIPWALIIFSHSWESAGVWINHRDLPMLPRCSGGHTHRGSHQSQETHLFLPRSPPRVPFLLLSPSGNPCHLPSLENPPALLQEAKPSSFPLQGDFKVPPSPCRGDCALYLSWPDYESLPLACEPLRGGACIHLSVPDPQPTTWPHRQCQCCLWTPSKTPH